MACWDDILFLEGKENIIGHLKLKQHLFLILGKGFDLRACRMLETFHENDIDVTVCLLNYNDETMQSDPANEQKSADNYEKIKKLAGMKLIEVDAPQYSGTSEKRTLIISETVRKVLTKELLAVYNNVLIDISAMPRSVSFSVIKRVLDIKKSFQKAYILVCENSEYDAKIRPKMLEESAQYLTGFNTFSMDMESEEGMTIWLPSLEINGRHMFEPISNFLKPVEICPIVPFPAVNIRKSENILREYGDIIFKTHAVDKRNVIYVPENYPKLIYRKLYETVVYYNKALSIDSEKPVKFAFSSQSSKLMDIGMLLTVLALLKKRIKVSIVIVENHGYTGETTYDINGEKLYALCLDESEFDW